MQELIKRYPMLEDCVPAIDSLLALMEKTSRSGAKLLLCGNGGSSADCDHIAGELMKGFLSNRTMRQADRVRFEKQLGPDAKPFAECLQYGIPAVSLTNHCAVLSAFANDVNPELVFAQQVWGLGREGDLLIGLSTSGNSKNVINAIRTAKVMNIKTAGLTGAKSCQMDGLCDVVIHAPETETYKVQELHLAVYHYLCAELEKRMFGEGEKYYDDLNLV